MENISSYRRLMGIDMVVNALTGIGSPIKTAPRTQKHRVVLKRCAACAAAAASNLAGRSCPGTRRPTRPMRPVGCGARGRGEPPPSPESCLPSSTRCSPITPSGTPRWPKKDVDRTWLPRPASVEATVPMIPRR